MLDCVVCRSALRAFEGDSVSDAEFGLVESFGIDDGQLEGLRPQECFVLGYELADISRRVDESNKGFSCLFHAENRQRISNALIKRNRRFKMEWMESDASESWMMLTVLRNTQRDKP